MGNIKIKASLAFVMDTIQALAKPSHLPWEKWGCYSPAPLVPTPMLQEEKGPGTHCRRMRRETPEKPGGIGYYISYTLCLSSIELHVMQNPRAITMVTRPVAMEMPAHAHTMCTRLFPPEGPGYEATTRVDQLFCPPC